MNEVDFMREIGNLQEQINALRNTEIGGIWTPYTPTALPGSGAFTTISTSGLYSIIGKICLFHANVTITTNGTAAVAVLLSYPVTPITAAFRRETFSGHAYNTASGAIRWACTGMLGFTAGYFTIYKYDGSYPGLDSTAVRITGFYERE